MMLGQTRAILPILRTEAAKEQWYRREEALDSEEKLADLEFDEEYYAKTLKEIRDQRVWLPIGVTGDNIHEDEASNMEMEEEEEYSLAEMEDMGNFAGESDEPVEG